MRDHMVGRGAALDVRLFLGGTDGSNPVPSSEESANNRFLAAEPIRGWQGQEARRQSHRQSRLRPNRVRYGLPAGGSRIRTIGTAWRDQGFQR